MRQGLRPTQNSPYFIVGGTVPEPRLGRFGGWSIIRRTGIKRRVALDAEVGLAAALGEDQ